MHLRITNKCLKGDVTGNPLAAIEHFHWEEDGTDFVGVYTNEELCRFVKTKGQAYMLDPQDHSGKTRIPVVAASLPDGKKYAVTLVNGQITDHLLQLPNC